VKVVIREAAARDLDDILDWISKDNPQAAARLVRRILARIDRLAASGLPHVGRPGAKGHANSWKRRISLSILLTSPPTKSRCWPSSIAREIARTHEEANG
jgi:plasmid stabilization system protein ParE